MDVKYYLYHFARLHTAKLKGKQAPHKAVLLLAVMSMIERGRICSAEIELTDELVSEFRRIWQDRVPESCPFSCDICKPFFHMQHEPFWRLIEHEENYFMVAEELGLYTGVRKPMVRSYTLSALRECFRCAKIDKSLLEIMKDDNARKELENLLISKYLAYDTPHDRTHSFAAMIGAALLLGA